MKPFVEYIVDLNMGKLKQCEPLENTVWFPLFAVGYACKKSMYFIFRGGRQMALRVQEVISLEPKDITNFLKN